MFSQLQMNIVYCLLRRLLYTKYSIECHDMANAGFLGANVCVFFCLKLEVGLSLLCNMS